MESKKLYFVFLVSISICIVGVACSKQTTDENNDDFLDPFFTQTSNSSETDNEIFSNEIEILNVQPPSDIDSSEVEPPKINPSKKSKTKKPSKSKDSHHDTPKAEKDHSSPPHDTDHKNETTEMTYDPEEIHSSTSNSLPSHHHDDEHTKTPSVPQDHHDVPEPPPARDSHMEDSTETPNAHPSKNGCGLSLGNQLLVGLTVFLIFHSV